jgi:hypothetical protein
MKEVMHLLGSKGTMHGEAVTCGGAFSVRTYDGDAMTCGGEGIGEGTDAWGRYAVIVANE